MGYVPKQDPWVGIAIIRGHSADWDSIDGGSSLRARLAVSRVFCLWKSANMDEVIIASIGEVIRKV
jgi:hypothetical protein